MSRKNVRIVFLVGALGLLTLMAAAISFLNLANSVVARLSPVLPQSLRTELFRRSGDFGLPASTQVLYWNTNQGGWRGDGQLFVLFELNEDDFARRYQDIRWERLPLGGRSSPLVEDVVGDLEVPQKYQPQGNEVEFSPSLDGDPSDEESAPFGKLSVIDRKKRWVWIIEST